MRNLLIDDDYSVVDDRICPPPTVRPEDLGHLLDTVSERLWSGGVLMLAGTWAAYVTTLAEHGGTQDSPREVQEGDWAARVVEGDVWIRWRHRDGHQIWTCEAEALPAGTKDAPLAADKPMLTALNFSRWAERTGQPWVGTPGMSGNSLLVDGWADANPKSKMPRWRGGVLRTYPASVKNVGGVYGWPDIMPGAIEQAYTTRQWSREHTGPVHGYDLNMAYLSAYKVAELPVDELEHHRVTDPGADVFHPRIGGIWRVELSPWLYGSLLPDPAGYAPALADGTRWLTTPTLHLLQQLTERGDYGGFRVLEWYGAPVARITRKWADTIHSVITEGGPLAPAAKNAYKQTYGMWHRPTRVWRPDWHYTIIATNRANLWRKLDHAYRGEKFRSIAAVDDGGGYLPVRIDTDAVFYDTLGYNWEGIGTALRFKLDPSGMALGHFKPVADK